MLCLVDETGECLLDELRKGDVLDDEECGALINQIKARLPGCVKKLFCDHVESFSGGQVFLQPSRLPRDCYYGLLHWVLDNCAHHHTRSSCHLLP